LKSRHLHHLAFVGFLSQNEAVKPTFITGWRILFWWLGLLIAWACLRVFRPKWLVFWRHSGTVYLVRDGWIWAIWPNMALKRNLAPGEVITNL
jgi:hypothetical protein